MNIDSLVEHVEHMESVECYICEKQTHPISLYYLIGENPEYIDPKTYQGLIPAKAKPICSECLIKFLLNRQSNLRHCKQCQRFYSTRDKTCQTCQQANQETGQIQHDSFYHFTHPKGDNCKLCSIKVTKPYVIGGESEGIEQIGWVGFSGPNIFSGWLGDTYQIVSDEIIADAGNVVCDKCLDKYTSIPHLSVECNLCKKRFQATMPGSKTQGLDCASTVRDHCIYGDYGSRKYDMEIIKFADERPKNIKYGSSVCDGCITDLIRNGICVRKSYYPSDEVDSDPEYNPESQIDA